MQLLHQWLKKTILIEKRFGFFSTTDPVFKYIYFNHMNLAQQTTVHLDLQKRAGINIPHEIMRLLNDINADLTK